MLAWRCLQVTEPPDAAQQKLCDQGGATSAIALRSSDACIFGEDSQVVLVVKAEAKVAIPIHVSWLCIN